LFAATAAGVIVAFVWRYPVGKARALLAGYFGGSVFALGVALSYDASRELPLLIIYSVLGGIAAGLPLGALLYDATPRHLRTAPPN
jgi:hypothetical protein